MKRHLAGNAIKESFDNLPSGICYFNASGLPVLCNRQMSRLVFAMTGQDLQLLSDLSSALSEIEKTEGFQKDGSAILFPDGTVWQFSFHSIVAEEPYTQFVASNITELYHRKKELETRSAEQVEMVASLKTIVKNVTAITREEEILTMKMHIHDKVGWFLQRLRRYKAEPNHYADRIEIAVALQSVADALQGEIGHDDVVDPLVELCRVATSLGVTVEITGVELKNSPAKKLIHEVIRECVTNTIRHAEGDKVFVSILRKNDSIVAEITNNGKQPATEITEGGGLGSLRRQTEKMAGSMYIQSLPYFMLTIVLPKESEE
ncbi:sensor histidine kinase [Dysosmobacter sp.]